MIRRVGEWFIRLRNTFGPAAADHRFREEMRWHVDMSTERNLHAGMSADEARRSALASFGGGTRHQQSARDEVRHRRLEEIGQDLKYAWRGLRRRRAATAVIVVALALGLGAVTAVFSVVNGVLLRPLRYAQSDRMVTLRQSWNGHPAGPGSISPAEYFDYADQLKSFEAFGVYVTGTATLTGEGVAEEVPAVFLTAGAMQALGVRPRSGRIFTAAEDGPLPYAQVALITADLWRARYGGANDVLGRRIISDGQAVEVIGILPDGFRLPDELNQEHGAQVFLPMGFDRTRIRVRGSHMLSSVARLRPGTSFAAAEAEVGRVARDFVARLPADYPVTNAFTVTLAPLQESVVGAARPTLLLLLGAACCVLLIACINSAGLLLAQAESRRQEMALRRALGAGQGRLVRQLLVESLVLALLAGIAGVVLAMIGIRALVQSHPVNLPRLAELSLDRGSLWFALGAAMLAAVLFGLVPALRLAKLDLQTTLRSGGKGSVSPAGDRRLRGGLIVAQIALAAGALFVAGLLTRSFVQLQNVDPGFRPDHLITGRVSLSSTAYPTNEEVIAFFEQLAPRLAAMPGVTSIGAVAGVPLAAPRGDLGIELEGQPVAPGQIRAKADWQVVTPGYLGAIGMRLLEGRDIAPSDRASTMGVAVINEAMAKRYWPGRDPIGQRFKLGAGAKPDTATVIGVVADVHQAGPAIAPDPEMYLAHAQFQFWGGGGTLRSLSLVVRTVGEPTALTPVLRSALQEMAPNVPLSNVRTMDELRGRAVAQPRFMMVLLTAISLLALTVAVVGLYGAVAYQMAARRKEFGVRMALGATGHQVVRQAMRGGLFIVGVGMAIGLPAALLATRFLRRFLFEVSPSDPLLLAAVLGLLGTVALVAVFVPARRASHVAPMEALRNE